MSVLIAGFEGDKNSSKILIDFLSGYDNKKYIPNDKKASWNVIKDLIQCSQYIICVGQKPLMKNKITIETQAKTNETILSSDFPYISLEKALKDTYPYKNSKNAGTSYCNYIYYKALEYLQENRSDSKVRSEEHTF